MLYRDSSLYSVLMGHATFITAAMIPEPCMGTYQWAGTCRVYRWDPHTVLYEDPACLNRSAEKLGESSL